VKLPCTRCQKALVDVNAALLCQTCVHGPTLATPIAELPIPAQIAGNCGNCGRPMLLSFRRWTTCAVCETQSTALS
jgi:hypothetical protein